MNIGIVVDNELIDDKRVLREISILRDGDHLISALCFDFGKSELRPLTGIKLSRIKLNKGFKNILFFFFNTIPVYEFIWARKICRFIRENNIEVIHAHDLYMSKCARMGIAKSQRNVILVLDLHENFSYAITTYNWTKGFIRRTLARPFAWREKEAEYLGYADRIVVLSSEFRDYLIERYNSLKIDNFCIMPNVPDAEQMESFRTFSGKPGFKKKSPLLFYFGIVAERRGIFEALYSFGQIIKKGFDIDFMIIGPVDKKDRKRFNRIIRSPEFPGRIIYIHWIDLPELPAYLDFADICIAPFKINPQHESGVANKIFDYMLGGKPVIASNCKPQKNLLEKYNCGLVYSDETQMEEAIITLLGDKELRERMGNNGRRAILDGLNSMMWSKNLTDLYSSFGPEKAARNN